MESIHLEITEEDGLPYYAIAGKSIKSSATAMALAAMEKGSFFIKVKSKSWRKERHLKLSEDHLSILFDKETGTCRKRMVASSISIRKLKEIRQGYDSPVWDKLKKNKPESSLCFSLVIEGEGKPVNFIAATPEDRDTWVRGLKHLNTDLQSMDVMEQSMLWIWEYFKAADKDESGYLSHKEIKHMLRNINFHVNSAYVEKAIQKFDVSGDGKMNFEEFIAFFKHLSFRKELQQLFTLYCNEEDGTMDAQGLLRFLIKEQSEHDLSEKDAIELISRFEPSVDASSAAPTKMTVYGFSNMLLSEQGDIFDKKQREVYMDMTRPLSEYYIASSHNTYLTHDQLIGSSSVEAYVKVLRDGCRCVELDCWDGDNGEPIIYHGHTVTSKITLEDTVECIAKYAITDENPYPVILSIENHCSIPQQTRMAQIFQKYLGDKLLVCPVSKYERKLPSPEALKGKIILKCKKLPHSASTTNYNKQHILTDSVPDHVDDVDGDVREDDDGEPQNETTDLDGEVSEEDDDEDDDDDDDHAASQLDQVDGAMVSKKKKSKKKLKLSHELSNLIVYTISRSFKGFDDAVVNSTFKHISSLNEDKARSLIDSQEMDFIKHNVWQLVRIYPKGTRIKSSNYNPVPMWNVGCQVVALNYQNKGKETYLNLSQFRRNGGCGYILKPECLRALDNPLSLKNQAETPEFKNSIKIIVRLISGQQLPRPKESSKHDVIDPYVIMSVEGLPTDKQSKTSDYVPDNGFNPMFTRDEPFAFDIKVPELAFLTFKVMDRDSVGSDDYVGWFTTPVNSLATGYRHVHLEDYRGRPLKPASLFVHISIIGPPSANGNHQRQHTIQF